TFAFALSIFTLCSALCGLAWNVESLIAFRLLQGVGGGMLTPVAMAMLFRAFPEKERAAASAVIAAERGYGVAMARWSLVAGDMQAGRLVCAADWAVHHHRAYYFVTTAAKARLPAVRTFADWLIDTAAGAGPPPTKLRRRITARRK
ncbi:MAG: MFS transporter, partial [Nevskiales bacterium]